MWSKREVVNDALQRRNTLEALRRPQRTLSVRAVKVCDQCGWNHMIDSYLLGDGVQRRPPRRQHTVEDIHG